MRSNVYVSLLFLLSLCLSSAAWGQIIQKPIAADDTAAQKRVRILNADSLTFRATDGEAIQKLIGHVKMKQDSTLFYCDSAYFYEERNFIKAYSHVKVEMSDSVTMYADRLTYEGNTRIAEVYDNILLTDLKSDLRTNRLTYFRNEEYGLFTKGGTLKDAESTLTSKKGYYYPNRDKAYFKGEVILENPDYVLETDTMGYDTDSKIAEFLTYTLITSEDGVIETTKGSYDTEAKKINLFDRSTVQDSSYTLTANTIRYIDDDNLGIATGDVLVTQEDSSLEIRGEFGLFNRDSDESTLTENPVAIQYMDEDTLYIFADTLRAMKEKILAEPKKIPVPTAIPDTAGNDSLPPVSEPDSSMSGGFGQLIERDSLEQDSLITDSLQLPPKEMAIPSVSPPDTIERRVFRGNYNVRFFMNEMQGRCDSMIYFYDDSTIFLHGSPILWSEQGQITGDTIKIWMQNNKVDSMWIGPNGFLVSEADTVGFDQIKGKELRAKFRNNELAYLHVIGNAESMYFIKNEDSTQSSYEGLNQAIAQEMTLYFADNELNKILFKAKPSGTYSPIHEVIFKENTLQGMKWRVSERPEKPDLLATETGADELDFFDMDEEQEKEDEDMEEEEQEGEDPDDDND